MENINIKKGARRGDFFVYNSPKATVYLIYTGNGDCVYTYDFKVAHYGDNFDNMFNTLLMKYIINIMDLPIYEKFKMEDFSGVGIKKIVCSLEYIIRENKIDFIIK